jgi:hypothetical protein
MFSFFAFWKYYPENEKRQDFRKKNRIVVDAGLTIVPPPVPVPGLQGIVCYCLMVGQMKVSTPMLPTDSAMPGI